MNDAQRYRMKAAECLSAAERCGPDYRDLTLAIAASWLSRACHQEATDELLTIWSKAQSAAPSGRLTNIPATPLAVGLLRFPRGKQFQPAIAFRQTSLAAGEIGG
jgi:hypothetical protein